MVSIAIADDDPKELATLKQHFAKFKRETPEEIEIVTYSSGELLLSQYNLAWDIICLDIDMPGRDGIEIAKEIRKKDEQVIIIFITNMAQMAIRGYEVRALDFLIKPVDYFSFSMKMQSIINISQNQKTSHIVINLPEGMKKISTDELYYAEVTGHYLLYHTKSGVYKQKASMRDLEAKLAPYAFNRCNNCYLVNLHYVSGVKKDELEINGEWLKISRPRKKEFLKDLANYMGGIRS